MPTVIDMNLETVRALRAKGVRAIYGDVSQWAILETASIERASGLVFASNAPPFDIIEVASSLRKDLAIMTRTTYL